MAPPTLSPLPLLFSSALISLSACGPGKGVAARKLEGTYTLTVYTDVGEAGDWTVSQGAMLLTPVGDTLTGSWDVGHSKGLVRGLFRAVPSKTTEDTYEASVDLALDASNGESFAFTDCIVVEGEDAEAFDVSGIDCRAGGILLIARLQELGAAALPGTGRAH